MKRCPAAHLIDLLFPLALFCAFAVTSLLVVVVGADVYRRTTDEMDRNFALRTPLAYLSQAVHRTDLAGGFSIGRFGDGQALILSETVNGEEYRTYLYCRGGNLCELFARADAGAAPENGQAVTGCASFTVEEAGPGLYRIRCVTETGGQAEACVAARSDRSAP